MNFSLKMKGKKRKRLSFLMIRNECHLRFKGNWVYLHACWLVICIMIIIVHRSVISSIISLCHNTTDKNSEQISNTFFCCCDYWSKYLLCLLSPSSWSLWAKSPNLSYMNEVKDRGRKWNGVESERRWKKK